MYAKEWKDADLARPCRIRLESTELIPWVLSCITRECQCLGPGIPSVVADV